MTVSRLPDNVTLTPWRLTERERGEVLCSESLDDAMACRRTLFMGFFFDGTRNNLYYDEGKQAHSNVARLYRIFDDARKHGEERQYRFATYIPGVGTEFWKGVGDSGVGLHANAGAAAGWGGEARINWALLQLQNNLHLYALQRRLTNENEDRALVSRMSTDINLERMRQAFPEGEEPPRPKSPEDRKLRSEVTLAQSFQAIASTQWRDTNIDGRRQVLAERRAVLLDKLQPVLTGRLPKLGHIRISVFGFSRGATEARVFVNWLRDLCDTPRGPLRICGVPATVDFLGLFDTVASVGAAQGLLEDLATGHGGWGQRRDLRIPGPPVVTRCLHLVAGHEVRGSFPLDAAAGPNVEEVVYPGVHSDVGGGYMLGEQGRGMTDDAKLSQIPLCHMYRAALAAGVPLMDLTQAPPPIQNAFKVSVGLMSRFNAYMIELRGNSNLGNATTEDLVQRHYRQFLQWRRYFLDKYTQVLGRVASPQDRMDLTQANLELAGEWKTLLGSDDLIRGYNSPWMGGYTGALLEYGIIKPFVNAGKDTLTILGTLANLLARARFDDLPGGWIANVSPIVDGTMQSSMMLEALAQALESKHGQWKQVENAWNAGVFLPHGAVCALFERDVHDSRAWFKPLGDDDDVWIDKARAYIRELERKEKLALDGKGPRLSNEERKDLTFYRQKMDGRDAPNGEIPAVALPAQKSGRELSFLWGYLRWRTVYHDPINDYRSQYQSLANAERGTLIRRKRVLEREAETLDDTIRDISKHLQGRVMAGGGEMVMAEGVNQLGGFYARKMEVETELKAVQVFLDEMGPVT
ncbi:T6SS phospholipase effector Tle1-like catalytic domain-containing protein [Zestomonas carbonaria]|uniref:T6SS Phospholipase effector Tle1-like catalytic domain-containing protein n=1 Tax=Zestomonas carbonaria TaxID=2762745 RepID=A0A7U7IBE9_9GAMM|nr:DUF2235 domain-containing protein [Pseudomonas carbonaria]CAD5110454.1 hypothetical protein PSEWESI4_04777 [Pseudomonas carbonaria]